MDPPSGRFAQQDSFAGYEADPQSLHKYTYAGNSPAAFTDPSGLMTLRELGAAANAGLNLANVAITSFSVTTNLVNGNSEGAAKDLAISLIVSKAGAIGSIARKVVVQSLGLFARLFRSTRTVTLYRAVGVGEYNAIMATKQFSWGAFPTNMKQFAFTFDEALAYANTSSSYVAIIKVTVNESVVRFAHFSKTIDPFIFKNGVLTFTELENLNKAIVTLSHVL